MQMIILFKCLRPFLPLVGSVPANHGGIFMRAYSFCHHIEHLLRKKEEKITFQSHHFGLEKNVTLTPPNFFTHSGVALHRRKQMKSGLC